MPLRDLDGENVEEDDEGLSQLISEEDVDLEDAPSGVEILPYQESKPVKADDNRGRHVGQKALALIQRFPIVGLKYLGTSKELAITDNSPPPQEGEYAVAPLGVTTLEYGGIKQNHLLVTFKADKMSGFGLEDDYYYQELTLTAGQTDYAVDVYQLLSGRKGRTLVVNYNRNVVLKINSTSHSGILLYSVQSPYIIDLGLNVDKLYFTTTQETKVRLNSW